jgi:phage shock protein E
MIKRIVLCVGLVLIGPTACGSGSKLKPVVTYQTVSVQEAYEHLSQNQNAILVDVRPSEEWAAGHAAGAISIPLSELGQRAPSELPKEADIWVICSTGTHSRAAAESLISMGYTHVHNIAGGTRAWMQAGLPIAMP